ncbi:hypothetical protein AAF712_015014 [Marasmius tenuissimus]|uniref:Uncharacterized protein n=1 Tax=Marasmius tenuissimus TaxID=585030 RepID=A0ABR2ZBJ3_9AGAR
MCFNHRPRIAPSVMAARGRRLVSPARQQADVTVTPSTSPARPSGVAISPNTSPKKRKAYEVVNAGVDIGNLAIKSPQSTPTVRRSTRAAVPSEKVKAAMAEAAGSDQQFYFDMLAILTLFIRTSSLSGNQQGESPLLNRLDQDYAIHGIVTNAFDSDGGETVVSSYSQSSPVRTRPAQGHRVQQRRAPAPAAKQTVHVISSDEEAPAKRSRHAFRETLSPDVDLPLLSDTLEIKKELIDDAALDDLHSADNAFDQEEVSYAGQNMDEYDLNDSFIDDSDCVSAHENALGHQEDVDADNSMEDLYDARSPTLDNSRADDGDELQPAIDIEPARQAFYEDNPPDYYGSGRKGKGKAEPTKPDRPSSQTKLKFLPASRPSARPTDTKILESLRSVHSCGRANTGVSIKPPVPQAPSEPAPVKYWDVVVSDEEEDIYEAIDVRSDAPVDTTVDTLAVSETVHPGSDSSLIPTSALNEDVQCEKFAPVYNQLLPSDYPQGVMVGYKGVAPDYSPADLLGTYKNLSSSWARGRMVQSMMFKGHGPYNNITRNACLNVHNVPFQCIKMVVKGREVPCVWTITALVASSHLHSSDIRKDMAKHVGIRFLCQELELFQSVVCTIIKEEGFQSSVSAEGHLTFATKRAKTDTKTADSSTRIEDRVAAGKKLAPKQLNFKVTPTPSTSTSVGPGLNSRISLNYTDKVPVYDGRRSPNGSNRGFMFTNEDWDNLTSFSSFEEEIPAGSLVTVGFTMNPYEPFKDTIACKGVRFNLLFVVILDI